MFHILCVCMCFTAVILTNLYVWWKWRRLDAEVSRMSERAAFLEERIRSDQKQVKELEQRLKTLETGASPDYEKARAAAQSVNDFNSAITSIMNFDPYDSLKARRENKGGGGSE